MNIKISSVRKLTKKSGYSYVISIPKDLIKSLNWKERQKLILKPFGKGKIIITDWKK